MNLEATSIALKREFKLLYAESLSKSFGGLKAVDNFAIELDEGEIVGLIGPNGAGKTTVFNLITGMEAPDSGRIYFRRQFIHGLPAHRVARLGVARTFQNIRLLDSLSVLDNVKVAYHSHIGYGLLDAALRLPKFHAVEREIAEKSMEFLSLFDLADLAGLHAASLPYGMRRKLEIARALATEASLLLLDEPAAGLNPYESAELAELIRRIRDEFRVTVLLIEHDMKMVMNLCERIVVLNFGQVIAQGPPARVKADPAVIEAYLGVERE